MRTLEFVIGGADALARVRPRELGPERAVLTCGVGGWIADPLIGVCRGALGIVLDDVTGYVVAAGAPPGRWPVSLGIRLDFLADPPTGGPPLVAEGTLVVRDDGGGTTTGTVSDAGGTVIAMITQRSHLIDADGGAGAVSASIALPPADVPLRESLEMCAVSAGILEMSPTPYAANGMGNVHGGVFIVGSEFAAHTLLDKDFQTVSIDIAYARPGSAQTPTTFRADAAHRGRSFAVVRVESFGPDGKVCSVATVTAKARR